MCATKTLLDDGEVVEWGRARRGVRLSGPPPPYPPFTRGGNKAACGPPKTLVDDAVVLHAVHPWRGGGCLANPPTPPFTGGEKKTACAAKKTFLWRSSF